VLSGDPRPRQRTVWRLAGSACLCRPGHRHFAEEAIAYGMVSRIITDLKAL
jgi:hypothetical protein